MKPSFIFVAIGAVLLILFLKEKVKKYSIKATCIKALTSVMFILTAAFSLMEMPGICDSLLFKALFIGGLLFGLLGDIWLDLKYVYRNDDTVYTYLGFVSFAIGHIFYITAMILVYGISPIYITIPIVIGIVLGIGTGLMGKMMKLDYGRYKGIVMVYGSILFSMTLLAGSLALMYRFNIMTLNMIFIGGVFFIISDLILSGTYFGVGKERPVDIITNGVTYYGAQFIIALSLLFM